MVIAFVIGIVIGTAIGYVCRSLLRSGEVSWAYYEGVMDGIELESWRKPRRDVRNVSTNDLQANSDLLFCPFCGGDAHVKEVVSACETLYTVGCSDSECMGYETWLLKPTKDEAISAWNRRAERTCHMIDNGCELCCSECDTRHEYDLEPNYCLNCGAKVITDGDR